MPPLFYPVCHPERSGCFAPRSSCVVEGPLPFHGCFRPRVGIPKWMCQNTALHAITMLVGVLRLSLIG